MSGTKVPISLLPLLVIQLFELIGGESGRKQLTAKTLENGECCHTQIRQDNQTKLYLQLRSETRDYKCFCVRLLCDKQLKDSKTWQQNNKRNKELKDEEFLNVPICSSCRIIYNGIPLDSVTYCEGQVYGEVIIENSKFKLDGDDVQLEDIDHSVGDTLKQLEVNDEDTVEDDFKPLVVEILIATDESVSVYYEEEELGTYLKTVVDKASDIFSDSSLGTDMSLALRHIVHLNNQHTFRNSPIHSTSKALDVFCGWQQNYGSANSLTYDIAILMTRTDICYNNSLPDSEVCQTLGLANMGVMCDASRSCAIVQDNGLTAAHTISHEIGHTMGIDHDANDEIHVMSPVLHSTLPLKWSNKSRKQIGTFIGSNQASCLTNTSQGGGAGRAVGGTGLAGGEEGVPVGALYDAGEQCRLRFGGENTSVCDPGIGEEEFCIRLWCSVNQTCSSDFIPPADGTLCGTRKWCFHKKCVSIEESKEPVDGSWGAWSAWSSCSTTCGGGIMSSNRQCDNPVPKHQGRYCKGKSNRHRVCGKVDCLSTALSYRTVQCHAMTNTTDFTPVVDHNQPCALFCHSDQRGSDKTRRSSEFWEGVARDGTPCNNGKGEGARDMCVSGKCTKVGCDWVLGSSTMTDRCGVCGGDGSLCEEIIGEYMDSGKETEYVEVMTVPEGARRIRIEMQGSPINVISIVGDESGKSYLNWDWKIQWPGEYSVGGTTVVYTRGLNNQSVYIEQKITETLVVFLLRQLGGSSVSWSLIIPFSNATYQVTYSWQMSAWTTCNSTCGGGFQISQPVCQQDSHPGVPVRSELCEDDERPDTLERSCGNSPCPPTWWIGPWQSCSRPCGGVRQRTVLCVNHKMGALLDRMCREQPRPESIQDCRQCSYSSNIMDQIDDVIGKEEMFLDERELGNEVESGIVEDIEDGSSDPGYLLEDEIGSGEAFDLNEAMDVNQDDKSSTSIEDNTNGWIFSNWSECSKPCGSGLMHREVSCLLPSCPPEYKPLDQSPCDLGVCRDWIVGAWLTCSTLCGPGVSERKVNCSGVCDPDTRPSHTQPCHEGPCSVWWAGPWSKCNITCGSGFKFRSVECRHSITEVQSTECSEREKPIDKNRCQNMDCTTKKSKPTKTKQINFTKTKQTTKTTADKVTRTSQRCRDSLKSTVCFNFRHLCNRQILFSKKCCQTCFRIYKMRRLKQRFNGDL